MGEPRSFPRPHRRNAHELSRSGGLGCSLFARRYSGNRGCFLFLGVLRWFTSPRSRRVPYEFRDGHPDMTPGRLPHSEILGSKPVCGSPRLIAACHVLRRLPAPRHPPYALSSLTSSHELSECFLATPMLAMSKTEPRGRCSRSASRLLRCPFRISRRRAGSESSEN